MALIDDLIELQGQIEDQESSIVTMQNLLGVKLGELASLETAVAEKTNLLIQLNILKADEALGVSTATAEIEALESDIADIEQQEQEILDVNAVISGLRKKLMMHKKVFFQ